MKNNLYFRNIALTVLLGLALAVCTVIRAFAPYAVLPRLDVPNMVLLSMAALVADHYLTGSYKKVTVFTFIGAAVSFAVLPWIAGCTEIWKLALVGGVIFTACAWLFETIQDRLSTGPAAKAAPLFSALGLYLASQCLMGMIL